MTNNVLDFIHQLSEKLDSLWRYEEYIKNAKDCKECQKLWEKCRDKDLEMVEALKKEIENHIKAGNFEVCEKCFVRK